MYMLKVRSQLLLRRKTDFTISIELDDDDDSNVTTESPETAVLTTEDTSLDAPREPTPTQVHTEPSAT